MGNAERSANVHHRHHPLSGAVTSLIDKPGGDSFGLFFYAPLAEEEGRGVEAADSDRAKRRKRSARCMTLWVSSLLPDYLDSTATSEASFCTVLEESADAVSVMEAQQESAAALFTAFSPKQAGTSAEAALTACSQLPAAGH